MAAELRTSNADTEAAPSELETINIDPEGDLLIDASIPIYRHRFRVCSNALRRQSPVWKRMLFGPWKEAKPTDGSAWIVELPDDCAYSLCVIFCIIHAKFEPVPPDPTVPIVHNILILTHKYDITGIARPWCSQWLEAASEINPSAADVVGSLYIAWELGDEHLFALKLEEISLQARIDSECRLVYGENIVLEDEIHLGPHDVLDTISQIRMALLRKLIAPVHDTLEARVKEEPFCTYGDGYNNSIRRVCDAAVIGCIYRGMTQTMGGIPPRSAFDTKDSVVELASSLFSTMAQVSTTHPGLTECSPRLEFRDLNNIIHDEIPAVVAGFMKPGYKEYMAKQRLKTGVGIGFSQDRELIRYWKEEY